MSREILIGRLTAPDTSFGDPNYLVHLYLFKALKEASEFASGRLLDIGCGNKPYRRMFDKVEEYFGCDIVQSSEKLADFISLATDVSLASESFDTVFSTQVIEHVAEPWKLCSEAFRLLRPGGHFIVTGPMYWHLHEEPSDFYRFTKYGFSFLLENAGFEIARIVPNGGKWAMFGLVANHTFLKARLNNRFVIRGINRLCSWLDKRSFDDISTSNYLVIAKKNDSGSNSKPAAIQSS